MSDRVAHFQPAPLPGKNDLTAVVRQIGRRDHAVGGIDQAAHGSAAGVLGLDPERDLENRPGQEFQRTRRDAPAALLPATDLNGVPSRMGLIAEVYRVPAPVPSAAEDPTRGRRVLHSGVEAPFEVRELSLQWRFRRQLEAAAGDEVLTRRGRPAQREQHQYSSCDNLSHPLVLSTEVFPVISQSYRRLAWALRHVSTSASPMTGR